MKTSRKQIVSEIKGIFNELNKGVGDNDYNGIDLYIYKGFEGTMGEITIDYCKDNDWLGVVGYYPPYGDEDYLFISQMRTRSLLAIRNALFREYGKRMFRKKK